MSYSGVSKLLIKPDQRFSDRILFCFFPTRELTSELHVPLYDSPNPAHQRRRHHKNPNKTSQKKRCPLAITLCNSNPQILFVLPSESRIKGNLHQSRGGLEKARYDSPARLHRSFIQASLSAVPPFGQSILTRGVIAISRGVICIAGGLESPNLRSVSCSAAL